MIESQLLLDYMLRFVGFGDPSAPAWFIGLEQGGGKDLAELERRLGVWRALGSSPFVDFRDYCLRIGEDRWHGTPVKIQRTLGPLIRLTLASQRYASDDSAVRAYQANRFARLNGGTMIAELMPLPSRNVAKWIYSSLNDVPGLQSRRAYLREYRSRRISLLREAILEAAPQTVVFLGMSAVRHWTDIAGVPFEKGPAGAMWARSEKTRFVAVTHPAAHGITNGYFEEVGRELEQPGR